MRPLERFRRGYGGGSLERGSSAVEFAIVAPLLFFLLFAIIDLCVLFWVNLTMQHAVREGARYAVTGQDDADPSVRNRQRHLAVVERIKDSSMGLYDRVQPRINGIGYGDPSKYTAGMFGAAGQIMVLRLDCVWPLMTPLVQPFFKDGKYTFSVAATMRNEAFP
ncbi:TadE/TadG family type IV pilus assembly protein [Noviherbaspirillum sp.]|uniref:TadE/TadG family type IV pilus assembly protein n=1 Tax=Noviherbaspirillum sp. TaxID=1926288 RepID=UPI002FE3A11F